jgi:hypothetical protein
VTVKIRVFTLVALLPMALYGQTGSLVGSVASDSLGHPIAGADIRLPALGVTRAANYAGEFRFDGLPPGRVVVAIRSIGFRALQDTIIIVGGRVVQREYVLLKQVVALDSVRITANSERHISPLLRGFEERKRAGFGHFIDEDVLRKNDDHTLTDLLTTRIPGVVVNRAGRSAYLASSRAITNSASGQAFAKPQRSNGPKGCWVTIYLDGVLYFDPANIVGDPPPLPPDLNSLDVSQYAGIEYYAGGASMPAEFSRTSNGCGLLLLWTRER